jgi:hypothetical protein
MVAENPTWGAPRIHGELKMLGFDISERSVLRWMKKVPTRPEPGTRWATFLINHREAIAAMDFFTTPTLTCGVLYCFFVIAHDRRRGLRRARRQAAKGKISPRLIDGESAHSRAPGATCDTLQASAAQSMFFFRR